MLAPESRSFLLGGRFVVHAVILYSTAFMKNAFDFIEHSLGQTAIPAGHRSGCRNYFVTAGGSIRAEFDDVLQAKYVSAADSPNDREPCLDAYSEVG